MPQKKQASRTPTGPVVVRTSEMATNVRPAMIKFIQGLGYPKKKGEAFADGYLAEVGKLSILEKLQALENQNDRCMTAGFKAAGISEKEALKRNNKK